MRKFAIALLLVVALTLGLTGTAIACSAPNATGGGKVDYPGCNATFAFTAIQVNNTTGVAKGEFEYADSTGVKFHGKVLYLAVAGNNAWIGCNITKSNVPGMVGIQLIFEVQDNGQGKKATGPDLISYFPHEPASDALSEPDLFTMSGYFPLAHGNIWVFPGK